MAKSSLPSVDDRPAEKQQQRQLPEERRPDPVIESYQHRLSSFRRVDVKLPMRHRAILRDKLRVLQDSGARLQDGTEVTDKTKAVLWILENEVMV